MSYKKSFGAAALSVAAILSAGPAYAQMDEAKHMTVTIGDLDLASAEGRERAETRIRSAVRAVCPDANVRDLKMRTGAMACRTETSRAAQIALGEVSEQRLARAEQDAVVVVAQR